MIDCITNSFYLHLALNTRICISYILFYFHFAFIYFSFCCTAIYSIIFFSVDAAAKAASAAAAAANAQQVAAAAQDDGRTGTDRSAANGDIVSGAGAAAGGGGHAPPLQVSTGTFTCVCAGIVCGDVGVTATLKKDQLLKSKTFILTILDQINHI